VEERRPDLVLMEIEFGGCDGLDLMAGIEPDHPQLTNRLMAHDFRSNCLL
jgi:CheY-like chemotaxis protein